MDPKWHRPIELQMLVLNPDPAVADFSHWILSNESAQDIIQRHGFGIPRLHSL